jgi:hypothetical protein
VIGVSSVPLTKMFLLDFEMYLVPNKNHSFLEN